MMTCGTDTLSRGVDIPITDPQNNNILIPLLWRPVPPSIDVLQWVVSKLPPSFMPQPSCHFHTDFTNWYRSQMLNNSVL